MGALDSNGIWIYDENEDAAPFSVLLNRLGQSVSDVVQPLVNPGPTDWTSVGITAGPNITLANVAYTVDPFGLVSWRGELWGTPAPSTNALLFTMPTAIRPTLRMVDEIGGASSMVGVFLGAYGGTGALEELRYRYLVTGSWPTTAPQALSLAGLQWRCR